MRVQILLNFKKGTYAEIFEFCTTVVQKMNIVERYAAEQKQLDVVIPLLEAYEIAMVNASDGGKTLILLKQKARKELLDEMTELAKITEVNAKMDESYALDAGWKIKQKPQRNTAPLEAPLWKNIKRGVLSGTIDGEFQNFPKGVNEVGLAYSTDNWKTEHNGTYSSGKKFTISELPIRQAIQVRGRFIGTYQRKSEPSEPMEIFVL